MTATIELNSARRKLQATLGEDRAKDYFFHLKQWFRRRLTKEEFDAEARKLLPASESHLHNEFLLAVLNKCQTLANLGPSPAGKPSSAVAVSSPSSSVDFSPKKEDLMSPPGSAAAAALAALATASPTPPPPSGTSSGRSPHGVAVAGSDRLKRGRVKRKSRSGRVAFDQRFVPSSGVSTVDENSLKAERGTRFAYREPTLPDVALAGGRAMLAAWEEGVEGGAADDAAELIVAAVEAQLRKLVSALVMRRKGYSMKDGRFPCAIGISVANPWTHNFQRRRPVTVGKGGSPGELTDVLESGSNGDGASEQPWVPVAPPAVADVEQAALYSVALASKSCEPALAPVSLFDLYGLLRERKTLLPCHSVYAINVERIASKMHHEDANHFAD
jgi:transcriptional adapter 1